MTSKLLLSLISTAPLPVAVLFANVNTPGGSPTAVSDSSLIAASLCPLILVPVGIPGPLHRHEPWSSCLSLIPTTRHRPQHYGGPAMAGPPSDARLPVLESWLVP